MLDSTVDYVLLVVFGIVYLQMFLDRRWWLGVYAVMGVFSFALMLYPHALEAIYGSSTTDDLFNYIVRILAVTMFCMCVTVFAMEYSEDPTVSVALSTSRIVAFSTMAFAAINTYYFENDKTLFSISDLVSIPVLVAYDILNMPKLSRRFGSLTVGDPLSFHLTFDFYISFVLGILILAFPHMFLYTVMPGANLTASHTMLTRCVGTQYLGFAIASLCSLSFKNTEDVENILKTKLLQYSLTIFFIFLTMFFSPEFANIGQCSIMIGVNGLLFANTYIATNNHNKFE